MTVQDLLRHLPELSKADLEKIRQRIQLLTGGDGSKARTDLSDDWLLTGVSNELRRRGLLAGKVWSGMLPKSWEEKAAPVREYLLEGFNTRLNRTQRVAIAQLAAEKLIAHLEPWADRITPKLVLSTIDRVPAALEDSFPGYWAARSMHFCLLYKGSTTACHPRN